jgi:secretion/DNA translocation related TadE-like protein
MIQNNESGFSTVFSMFLTIIIIFFTIATLVLTSVFSTKHKAENSAEQAALSLAKNYDCQIAEEIAFKNGSQLVTCDLEKDYVYVETFTRFNQSQIDLFSKIGFFDEGLIGKAKAH